MAMTDYMYVSDHLAWVNMSGTNIPVWGTLGDDYGFVMGEGTQIGSIYPNEFYVTVIPADYANANPNQAIYSPYKEIRFRNSSGAMATGYINVYPQGATYPEATWLQYQEPYHYYNSNGSTLVKNTATSINGKTCYVFSIAKAVTYLDPSGSTLGTFQAAGAKLATTSSTTGSTNKGYMFFDFYQPGGTGTWQTNNSKGIFVDLGLNLGSEPANRAIR